ncbi:MAG: hypothetical protein JRI23_07945 [Deltaproteobacteria bacterium]|jgi:hypothetical protein|nr:hypothetical protein [Deltaproteobacteria bacterium]MBW2531538.1 hypothetical protein [Deltaproteobacteria bacterium]
MTSSTSTESCPWCGKPVSSLTALCDNCHRSPAQHPSLRPAKKGADLGMDLELGSIPPPAGSAAPPGKRAAQTAAAPVELPAADGDALETVKQGNAPAIGHEEAIMPSAAFGIGGLYDDDEIEDLEVELATGEPTAGPASEAAAGPSSAAPSSAGQPAPPSSAAFEALPTPDQAAVVALADYGEQPPNIVGVVPYAIKVLRRRPALRRLLADRRAQHDQILLECRTRYASMLDQLRRDHPDNEAIALRAKALEQTDMLLQERSAQLQQAERQTAAQVAAVDQEMSGMERDRAALEQERRKAKTAFDGRAEQRDRAKALVKRADIQLRALHEAARQAAGKGAKFAPPEHAKRIAAADAKRAELAHALEQHQAAFDEAQKTLRVHQAALREIDRRMAEVRSKRRGVEQAGSQKEALQAQGVKLAELEKLEKCEQAIKQLLAERHTALTDDLREEIHGLDARIRTSLLDVETHRQAVDAYDRPSVRNGVILLVLAAAVVIAVLVAGINVGGGAPPPPPPTDADAAETDDG